MNGHAKNCYISFYLLQYFIAGVIIVKIHRLHQILYVSCCMHVHNRLENMQRNQSSMVVSVFSTFFINITLFWVSFQYGIHKSLVSVININ